MVLKPHSTIFQLIRGVQFYWCYETGVNHCPAASHWQTWSHKFVSAALSMHQQKSNWQLGGERQLIDRGTVNHIAIMIVAMIA